MDPQQVRSRFAGTIVGFAVGDALGMPAQYLTRAQIHDYYGGPITTYVRAHKGHSSYFLPRGSYTDDTQLMLVTASCLIECGGMEPAKQADALLFWYRNSRPHRTPMRANELACKHLSAGRAWSKSGVFSSGCGAAMRMPPLALLYHRSPEMLARAAVDNCIITHTEPRTKAASLAVACLIARLIRATEHSVPGDQVLETADRVQPIDSDMAAMLRWVTQIVPLSPEEALFEIGASSDSMELVPAATYCFLKHPRDFAAAVLAAVNAGDAADSLGSLAGSFVGAFCGIEAIPKPWRQEIENRDVLLGVAEHLACMSEDMESNSAPR